MANPAGWYEPQCGTATEMMLTKSDNTPIKAVAPGQVAFVFIWLGALWFEASISAGFPILSLFDDIWFYDIFHYKKCQTTKKKRCRFLYGLCTQGQYFFPSHIPLWGPNYSKNFFTFQSLDSLSFDLITLKTLQRPWIWPFFSSLEIWYCLKSKTSFSFTLRVA